MLVGKLTPFFWLDKERKDKNCCLYLFIEWTVQTEKSKQNYVVCSNFMYIQQIIEFL